MRLFTVHVPASAGGAPAYERAVFVRHGFNKWAFLFSALWCLWRGLWVAAIAILALSGALFALGRVLGVSPQIQWLTQFVLILLVGLEASNLRRLALGRRGFAEAGVVAASDLDEAEAVFFERTIGRDPGASPSAASMGAAAAPMARRGGDDIIGLFPGQGGR